MNIKPLADRLLVRPIPLESVTKSGIIIPETVKEKPQKGTVIAVGDGKKDEPMVIKNGDEVLYYKNAGIEIEIDKEKLLILRELEVLAIID